MGFSGYVNVCDLLRTSHVILRMRSAKFYITSSSAVAERPRDALCPSVVDLNKIHVITRADLSIIVT